MDRLSSYKINSKDVCYLKDILPMREGNENIVFAEDSNTVNRQQQIVLSDIIIDD